MQRQKTTAATSLRQFLLCTKAREKKGDIKNERKRERKTQQQQQHDDDDKDDT
jgi:hypothetical protein